MKKLTSTLVQETGNREEGDNKIAEHVERELNRTSDTLNEIKRYAEGSEKKIFDIVKGSVTEIKILLDEERTER